MPTRRSTSGGGGACGPPSPMTSTSSSALRAPASPGARPGAARARRARRARRRPRRCAGRGGGARRRRRRSGRTPRPRRRRGSRSTTTSPERWSRGRSIWVMSPVMTIFELKPEPRQEHLHLLGARVLRLVEDHERVVERAPAHEGQRRDLDDVALEMGRDLLGVDHVVQRVEQRPQVRVDLRHEVAGQEAQALAGLDRRAGEDDPVDLVAAERRGGHRDGQERLAGAGRADAEGDRVAADRVDVALLVDGLRRDLRRAVAPDDVLEDLGRRVVLVERVVTAAIVPSAISWPCSMSSDSSRTTRAARRRPRRSPSSVTTLPRRNRSQPTWPSSARRMWSPEPVSAGATSLETSSWRRISAAPPAQRGHALPSARPATRGIAAFMTLPMSLGDAAPVSATASATIARSSSSESSAGR